MEEGMFQSSEDMQNIAQEIDSDATEIEGYIDEIYALLDQKLGAEDDGQKVWFGPKSSVFLENIRNKKSEFENDVQCIRNEGRNLDEQAQAWNSFENQG